MVARTEPEPPAATVAALTLLCDGEPMVAQLATNRWCCLLCRKQSKSVEELNEHLCGEDHRREEAAGRLSGRIRGPASRLEHGVETARRACKTLADSTRHMAASAAATRTGRLLSIWAVDCWLWVFADRWLSPLPPPTLLDHTVGRGDWSLAACDVEIRACEDEIKGKGAFAKQPVKKGSTVGVYLGEKLSQEEYALRHFGDDATTPVEMAHMKERKERL